MSYLPLTTATTPTATTIKMVKDSSGDARVVGGGGTGWATGV